MLKFYRSNYDEFDPDNNGGDITDEEIESAVAHSFIPRVRPRMAELGGDRYFKFYIKTDIDIVTIGLDVAKFTDSETEEIYLTLANSNDEVESDLDKDNLRLYGGFKVTDIDEDNLQITADRDVSDFVKADDNVTFYDSTSKRKTAMIVDSVDTNKITFKEWSDVSVNIGDYGSSTAYINSLDKDEYIGIWIKQVVPAYTKAMEDPLDSFVINIWYDKK
jgi:hypothetical protein